MAHDEFNPDDYKMLQLVGDLQVGGTLLRAAIWRYKDGAPKLKVQRVTRKKDGSERQHDMGGVLADEARAVAELARF